MFIVENTPVGTSSSAVTINNENSSEVLNATWGKSVRTGLGYNATVTVWGQITLKLTMAEDKTLMGQ